MSNSEQKTIVNVLALYFISTILIVGAFSYSYYLTEKEKYINQKENELFNKAKLVFQQLKIAHNQLKQTIKYPRYKDFNSAIYDIDQNIIFGTVDLKPDDFNKKIYCKDDLEYFIFKTPQYYLGAAYIVVFQKGEPLFDKVFKKILFIICVIFLIAGITSVFLVRLILKPIRDNLKQLDNFIKDTTHELNTPVSTIMSNIELIQSKQLTQEKLNPKINRIKNASLTISNLYEDLVYLNLHEHIKSENKTVNINNTITERVEYFSSLFKSKMIKVNIVEKDRSTLFIDHNKIKRVIDNLLTNAVKYSFKNSTVTIIIKQNSFEVCDEGKGMTPDQIDKITQRYVRFDNTQGGFGIGFNIIYNIAKEYGLKIKITSKPKEGTCVLLSWQ